jgi:dCTP deaminase
MSVLSDRDILTAIAAGEIAIAPFDAVDVQPASVDLHLDGTFRVFRNNRYGFIDPRVEQPDLTEIERVADGEQFMLHPGEFVLGQTREKISLGNSLLGRLLIHSTAGYVDPGWVGNLTLELGNVARLPIALYPGMRIGQISFHRMSSEVERPYGSSELRSRYQGQTEPTASAAHVGFDDEQQAHDGARVAKPRD